MPQKRRTPAETAALIHQQTITGSARCGVYVSRGRTHFTLTPEQVTCPKCRLINRRSPPTPPTGKPHGHSGP
jgi:hypothetical protein